MPGNVRKVVVRRQKHQLMPDAQLSKERIDRSDLHSPLAALVAKRSGGDVILSVGYDQRKRRETVDNLLLSFGTGESLQKLLQNQSSRDDALTRLESARQRTHGGSVRRLIPPKC